MESFQEVLDNSRAFFDDVLLPRIADYLPMTLEPTEAMNRVANRALGAGFTASMMFPSVKRLLGKTSGGGVKLVTDANVVMALLAETGVALVHGSAFGLAGHMRLSYAAATSQLEDAVSRIQDFCSKIKIKHGV